MQIPALGLVKLSFIFFYRRLFCDRNSNRSFNIATWLVIGLITAWTVSFFLALLFACKTHFAAYWTSVYTVSHECVKTLIYENAFAISDTMTDIIVFVLPIPQVSSLLRIPRVYQVFSRQLIETLDMEASHVFRAED